MNINGFLKRRRLIMSVATLLVACPLLFIGSCDRTGNTVAVKGANGLTKIKVGYIGLTCEAPLFTAVEKGFFREEGLEPELVRCQWSQYKDVLALGGFDITHHLVMYFMKPIELGLDVKFTGGVHRGCLRVQAGSKGDIHTVEGLRNKRIGVPGMGTPPFVFANRVLGAHGIDPSKEIQWKVFPAGELGLALDKGLVDAVANSEPIGSLLLADGKVRNIADQAKDPPYCDEYCCAVIVNGKFLKNNPQVAAGATRAILKAAKWVQTNPAAAARLSVEKKYILSSVALNTQALANLNYIPSVSLAHSGINSAAVEMQKANMLDPQTDISELVRRAWADLDGVNDQWLEQLQVEKLADGAAPKNVDLRQFAAEILSESAQKKSCCISTIKR